MRTMNFSNHNFLGNIQNSQILCDKKIQRDEEKADWKINMFQSLKRLQDWRPQRIRDFIFQLWARIIRAAFFESGKSNCSASAARHRWTDAERCIPRRVNSSKKEIRLAVRGIFYLRTSLDRVTHRERERKRERKRRDRSDRIPIFLTRNFPRSDCFLSSYKEFIH